MKILPVIMCGGSGTRVLALSRARACRSSSSRWSASDRRSRWRSTCSPTTSSTCRSSSRTMPTGSWSASSCRRSAAPRTSCSSRRVAIRVPPSRRRHRAGDAHGAGHGRGRARRRSRRARQGGVRAALPRGGRGGARGSHRDARHQAEPPGDRLRLHQAGPGAGGRHRGAQAGSLRREAGPGHRRALHRRRLPLELGATSSSVPT